MDVRTSKQSQSESRELRKGSPKDVLPRAKAHSEEVLLRAGLDQHRQSNHPSCRSELKK